MKLSKTIIISVITSTLITRNVIAFDYKSCSEVSYYEENKEKCDLNESFTNTALKTISGIALIGGAAALINLASNKSFSHSNEENFYVQPTISTYNMVGGDVESVHLAESMSSQDYIKNADQYNDIRLAYSLARGFTGKGSEIAILDAGLDSIHGQAVAAIASGPIAPDANVSSYKIANNLDFISYKEIGEIINSNQTANIFNSSWSVSMSASALKSRNQLIQLTDRNFVDSLSNAAIKRDAIFVWAAGNDSKSQSSALSAIPIVMPELKGHFINVVAWDSSTGQLAEYSNKCGITKEYCITAPGSNINTGNGQKSGTSFAAPIVSAAIAVLKEAFPYMSSPEITELLFSTARDLGTPGIDEIYGHGMLDLERATRPVGANLVPIKDTNTMLPLRAANISAPIAEKIKSENITFAFFDSFGRNFDTKLSDNISSYSMGKAFKKLTSQEEIIYFSLNNLEFGLKSTDLFLSDGFLQTKDENLLSFIGTYNEIKINEITLFNRLRIGISSPKPETDSLITDFSNIYTTSFSTGIKFKDFTFSLAIPDTIIYGGMSLQVPYGQDTNRHILYKKYSIDLRSQPSIEYSLSYRNITTGFIDNPFSKNEFYIITKGKINF